MSLYSDAYGILDQCLRDILNTIKPEESDRMTRLNVINRIATSLQYEESTKGASIKPFGSYVSNLYTKWGDLDISVHVPTVSSNSMSKNYKTKLLKGIIRALRNSGVANYIEFIPNARVPLLKFRSPLGSISCDISIDNYIGVWKSKILLWISDIDERFRDMVLLTKEWAKAQQINDPKFGTLNSYSLCLLVIFHLQTCEPAILPPLIEIYQGNLLDDIKGTNFTSESHIEDVCKANIRRFMSQRVRKANSNSIGQLLVSFFHKFYNIRSLVSENVICTDTGQLEGRSQRWPQMSGVMLVDDPFEKPTNAARSVGVSGLGLISDAFMNTYHRLSSLSEFTDWNRLLAILTKHHINSEHEGRSRQWNNSQGSQTRGTSNGFPRPISGIQRQDMHRLESSSHNMYRTGYAKVNGGQKLVGTHTSISPQTRSGGQGVHNYTSGFVQANGIQRRDTPNSQASSHRNSAEGTLINADGFAAASGVYGAWEPGVHNSRSWRGSSQNQETANFRGQQMWRPK